MPRKVFGDWRDEASEALTEIYLQAVMQVKPLTNALIVAGHKEEAIAVTRRAMETVAPHVLAEFDLLLAQALKSGWRP